MTVRFRIFHLAFIKDEKGNVNGLNLNSGQEDMTSEKDAAASARSHRQQPLN